MIRVLLTAIVLLSLLSTSIAFETATLESATAEELLLFFEEEELIIATRRPTPVKKAPAIATVITAREIRNMGARNLLDVLKIVPGFGVSVSEIGAYMLEVRGIRTQLSEKVLMMIDGHPLNRNFVGTAVYYYFNDLPVENIKKIEIIRGPGSALYGANAFAAVINIITKSAEDTDGIRLTAKRGSFDTEQYNLLGGKSITDDFSISGSADYYRTEGARLNVEEDRLTGTPWTLAPGETSPSVEKTDLFLKAALGGLTYKGHYLVKRHGNYIGLAYALVDNLPLSVENYWHELSYYNALSDNFSINVKAFFDRYEQEGTFELFPDGYLGLFPQGMIGGPYLKNKTHGLDAQVNFNVSKSNHLIVGALYEKMKQYDVKRVANYLPPPGFTALPTVRETSPAVNWNIDVDREIMALYVQNEWEIMDNLNITAGVRHDNYSDFGDTTNPRAGIVWGINDNTDLKLLYGRAFRAPNFADLYTVNNIAALGNPDLDPETIDSYEAALVIRPVHNATIDLNFFYNKIDDLIIVDTSVVPSSFENLAKAEVKGVELGIKGQYTTDNYWSISYTYQDPKDPDTDERLPDVPLHRASASMNYGLTNHLNFHSDILWTGERSRQRGDTRDPVSDYTTVDLAVTAKNFNAPLEIQATIHNLFDEEYEDPDRSGPSQFVPYDFPREGISAMLNVSYKFF